MPAFSAHAAMRVMTPSSRFTVARETSVSRAVRHVSSARAVTWRAFVMWGDRAPMASMNALTRHTIPRRLRGVHPCGAST